MLKLFLPGRAVVSAAILFWCLQAVRAQERPQAFIGARIIPIVGAEIANGAVVIQRGKIIAIGPSSSTTIPGNAQRHDVKGKVILPGLVDSHSHIGGIEGGDSTAPIQPEVRVLDSFNSRDARIQKAQAGGVTTVNVMPGSGHLLSGQTLYLKLRDGKNVEDLLLRDASGTTLGGIKMANGTNPRRPPPFPGTRAKAASLVREKYIKAQEYREKIRRANGDSTKFPERDLAMETLVNVLEGRIIVHEHSHRHDDILTAIRLSQEFGFRVVLHHVSDAWMVADEIAKAKIPASIIVLDSPGGKLEAKDISFSNGAALEKAGVLVGFHTDDGITDSRLFLRSAGLAVRAGMTRQGALYGMTMAGARMLDLQDRVGSLEVGKDGDLIVLSGDPLSVYSHVLETWVEGQKVFDRSTARDHLYAVGGDGASHDQANMQDHLSAEEGY